MKHHDVLIIDDEERYADMLAKRLELRGCRVSVCYTGSDGIKVFKCQRFYLIVLDLQLPDIYGIEVLKQMKTQSPDIPVVILTGHGSATDREECMNSGAYDFIHKPLDADDLYKLLMKIKKRAA